MKTPLYNGKYQHRFVFCISWLNFVYTMLLCCLFLCMQLPAVEIFTYEMTKPVWKLESQYKWHVFLDTNTYTDEWIEFSICEKGGKKNAFRSVIATVVPFASGRKYRSLLFPLVSIMKLCSWVKAKDWTSSSSIVVSEHHHSLFSQQDSQSEEYRNNF